MRPLVRLTLLIAPLGALAGCGGQSDKATDPTGRPSGFVATPFPKAGVSVDLPGGWRKADGMAPVVVTVQSGTTTLAVWRYPRVEPLPVTHAALVAAKGALVGAIVQRDPTFRLDRARLLHVRRERAIEVTGTATVAGMILRLRSTHVYAQGAEFVVDGYAPPADFGRVDAQVFARVTNSLQISRPAA